MINPYVSVDCVILGFDGNQLNVLLIQQCDDGGESKTGRYKLPGSLIDIDEDLDDAAHRVLKQLTGLSQIDLSQFRAYGSKNRLSNIDDEIWLEHFHQLEHHFEHIVTIAYLSLIRINRKMRKLNGNYEAQWIPLNKLPRLAFDHNIIVNDSIEVIRNVMQIEPTRLFELLPRKFTAFQLRTVLEVISGKKYDIKNFHKKMANMPYIVQLNEKESGVSHRAAHYYKFSKTIK